MNIPEISVQSNFVLNSILQLSKARDIFENDNPKDFQKSFGIEDNQIIEIFSANPMATAMLLEEGNVITYIDSEGQEQEREAKLPEGTWRKENAKEIYSQELSTLNSECLSALLYNQAYEEWRNAMLFLEEDATVFPTLLNLVSYPDRQPAFLLEKLSIFGKTLEEIGENQQKVAEELYNTIETLPLEAHGYDKEEVRRRLDEFLSC